MMTAPATAWASITAVRPQAPTHLYGPRTSRTDFDRFITRATTHARRAAARLRGAIEYLPGPARRKAVPAVGGRTARNDAHAKAVCLVANR